MKNDVNNFKYLEMIIRFLLKKSRTCYLQLLYRRYKLIFNRLNIKNFRLVVEFETK